jgi:hypothetical protein
VASAADRRKLHGLLDALADDPHLNDRQRELVGELRSMIPAGASPAKTRAKPAAPKARGRASARRGKVTKHARA